MKSIHISGQHVYDDQLFPLVINSPNDSLQECCNWAKEIAGELSDAEVDLMVKSAIRNVSSPTSHSSFWRGFAAASILAVGLAGLVSLSKSSQPMQMCARVQKLSQRTLWFYEKLLSSELVDTICLRVRLATRWIVSWSRYHHIRDAACAIQYYIAALVSRFWSQCPQRSRPPASARVLPNQSRQYF